MTEHLTTLTLDEHRPAEPPRADPDELRRAIARVPAPVTLVTTHGADGPVGFTASSFVNISVDPPLVGVFVAETARSHGTFLTAEHVAINVLSDQQVDAATVFAGRGEDKFAAVELDEAFPDAPVVQGAMTSLVCRVHDRRRLGDHLMLVLWVTDLVRHTAAPLVYQDRTFRALADLLY